MKKEYVTFVRKLSQLSEGKRTLFIKDLTPGPRKYDTRLVRAELSKTPGRFSDGDVLWIRSETGYLHPQAWAMKILEDLPPYVPGQPWQDVFAAMGQLK
ncbi:MAG: phenylphosphate carboxylase subunit gamma [Deltaproteobacteria bacterium]|nr:phenylphosphate carboxylase subunit gamma [Deltaproteobacteria bacterium]